ncbi:unnamed protein product [Periconia digitata]|uniref:Uncharacterized protein n=1 Tax=Periconia digitata TaxID=1303443 RepID=A0A9W4U4F3_9PLEO|nr:unnamed protein product [Periconia digitata]
MVKIRSGGIALPANQLRFVAVQILFERYPAAVNSSFDPLSQLDPEYPTLNKRTFHLLANTSYNQPSCLVCIILLQEGPSACEYARGYHGQYPCNTCEEKIACVRDNIPEDIQPVYGLVDSDNSLDMILARFVGKFKDALIEAELVERNESKPMLQVVTRLTKIQGPVQSIVNNLEMIIREACCPRTYYDYYQQCE